MKPARAVGLILPAIVSVLVLLAPASAAEGPQNQGERRSGFHGSAGVKMGIPWVAGLEAEIAVTPSWSIVASAQTMILASTLTGGARYRFSVGNYSAFATAYAGGGETIPFDVSEKLYWGGATVGIEALAGRGFVRLAAEVGAGLLYFPDRAPASGPRLRPVPLLGLSAGIRF